MKAPFANRVRIEKPQAERALGSAGFTLVEVSTPPRLDSRHVKGLNVLFGNGGAHWVGRTAIHSDLSLCGNPFPATSIYNVFQDNIWTELDRQ